MNSVERKQFVKLPKYLNLLNDKVFILSPNLHRFLKKELLNKLKQSKIASERSINRYKQNGKYPVWFLKEYAKISKTDISDEIQKSKFTARSKVITLPTKVNSKLAYFFGYLQGDGCVESNKNRLTFTDEYKDQLIQLNELCKHLFGIQGVIREYRPILSKKPVFHLSIGSLVLNSFFADVLGMIRGTKTKLSLPDSIKNSKTLLRYYISGLFDADGTLPKNPETCKQFFIDITMKDNEFIKQIRDCLSKLGILTLKPYKRQAKSPNSDYISITWELRIRKKDEAIKFLKIVGFRHPDKQQRASRALKLMDQ